MRRELLLKFGLRRRLRRGRRSPRRFAGRCGRRGCRRRRGDLSCRRGRSSRRRRNGRRRRSGRRGRRSRCSGARAGARRGRGRRRSRALLAVVLVAARVAVVVAVLPVRTRVGPTAFSGVSVGAVVARRSGNGCGRRCRSRIARSGQRTRSADAGDQEPGQGQDPCSMLFESCHQSALSSRFGPGTHLAPGSPHIAYA